MDQNLFNPMPNHLPNHLPEQDAASADALNHKTEQPVPGHTDQPVSSSSDMPVQPESQPFAPAPQPFPEPVSMPVQPESQPFGVPVQPVPLPGTQPFTQPVYNAYQTPQLQFQPVPKRNVLSMISLCTGIGSLVMTFCLMFTVFWPALSLTFGLLGVLLGIAGILTGTISRKQTDQAMGALPGSKISTPMATAGLICGIVGVVLSILMTLSCLTCYFAAGTVPFSWH